MDLCVWRLTTTIEGDTNRSPKAFLSKSEAVTHAVETAYSIARMFQGGYGVAVSSPLSPDVNTIIIKLHKDDDALGELTLSRICSDDSLIRFKLGHPYVHEQLNNNKGHENNEDTDHGVARFG